MTEQHECEWGLSYDYSTQNGLELYFFCKKDTECHDRLVTTDDLEKIYNEYETLKRATEALSAEIEKFILFHHKTLHPRHKEGLRAIVIYILEGK